RSDRLDKAVNAQDWATVAKILEELERTSPKSWELQSIEAYVAALRNRYSEAVTYYDRALALIPKSNRTERSKLYVDRATARALNGSYHAARVDLEEAIALDKNNVLAHNNYAWLLATCPDSSVRDGQRAVQHARGASESLKHGSPIILLSGRALLTKERRDPLPSLPGYVAVPVHYSHWNKMLMEAVVNGHRARFVVDTGAGYSILDAGRAHSFGVSPVGANSPYGEFANLNGVRYRVGFLNSLRAGAMDFGSGPMALFQPDDALN